MSKNESLHTAKLIKNDEFYTLYEDVECEMNAYYEYNNNLFRDKVILCPCDDPEWSNFTRYFAANFERFGLKKLICTSYAFSYGSQIISDFEKSSPRFDAEFRKTHGKKFILEKDINKSGRIDHEDIQFEYLKGDGDFRSDEITKLRDESDMIITNAPFSLFREFIAWIMEANKKFAVIGNQNAITYKEIFPLIKDNKIWLGNNEGGSRKGNSMFFIVPEEYKNKYIEIQNGKRLMQTTGKWFTNIDHGKRHESMQLMTMEDNLKFNKKLRNKLEKEYGEIKYQEYDNYNAIEIPFSDAIPSDYDEVMGVPITFLDKYCPEQFEILNANDFRKHDSVAEKSHGLIKDKEASITYEKTLDNNNADKHNLATGNRQQATGNRQQATGNRQQATGNRQQATRTTYARICIRRRTSCTRG